MKNLILILICSSILLDAASNVGSTVLANTSSYENGVKAYENKDYKEAVWFFKASKEEYANVKMQLLWAKSEDALGRKDFAIAGYERVLMLEPKNIESAFRLIKLYKMDGQNDEAQEIASVFEETDLTQEQKERLAKLLSTNYEKMDSFTARIITKAGYDTNVASTPSNDDLDGFADTFELLPSQREALGEIKSSSFSQTVASLSYKHDLTEKGGWFVKATTNAMAQFNFDEPYYNTKYAKVSASLGYKVDKTTISFPLYYNRIHYLEQDLLQNYGIDPKISSVLASKYILNFGLKLNQKEFINKTMSSYDSTTYGANGSLLFIMGKGHISAGLSYDKTIAKSENTQPLPPRYIDNDVLGLSISSSYRFLEDLTLNADYKSKFNLFNENTYSKIDGVYKWGDEKRMDLYQSLGIGIKKKVFDALKASAEYRYSANMTNYNMSEYNKQMVSVGLEYSF